MGKERRDTKGRLLRVGESQDKNGRYWYKWTDAARKRHAVSSWRLTKADKVPMGKRDCEPLRDMVKQTQKDVIDGICRTNIQVDGIVNMYLDTLRNVKPQTLKTYRAKAKKISESNYGRIKVVDFKASTAKSYILSLVDVGLKHSTIKGYYMLMKSAFEIAVNDDLIRKNPFSFSLSTICKSDQKEKQALTNEEEKQFLEFVKNHRMFKVYYDGFYIMLNTGVRISEFCGITKDDIDFSNNTLHIRKQLIKYEDGNSNAHLTPLKTKNSNRIIPLDAKTMECIKHCYAGIGYTTSIDGYRGFLYYTKNGNPYSARDWAHRIEAIEKAYNKTHEEPLPHISPHVLRHTFCSKMFKAGCSLKTIQSIMGHSNVNLSLNTYTHIDIEYLKSDFEKMVL